jgi:hypothetical protein
MVSKKIGKLLYPYGIFIIVVCCESLKRGNKNGENKRHAQKEERLDISFSSISGESAEEERRFISALRKYSQYKERNKNFRM